MEPNGMKPIWFFQRRYDNDLLSQEKLFDDFMDTADIARKETPSTTHGQS